MGLERVILHWATSELGIVGQKIHKRTVGETVEWQTRICSERDRRKILKCQRRRT